MTTIGYLAGAVIALVLWLLVRRRDRAHHERKLKLLQDKIAARQAAVREQDAESETEDR